MGAFFIAFLIAMVILASFTQDSFIFNVVYLFAGAYLLGSYWNSRVMQSASFKRSFIDHAFPGETIPVTLELRNKSRLPAVWLQIQELVPLDIAGAKAIHKIVTLPSHGSIKIDYELSPKRRGYYKVGPLQFSSGDLLGLIEIKQKEGPANYLTVYPKVYPLHRFKIPSRSPMGNLKHEQPIFEDPSRPIGKRDYIAGDSLRRIDWKASASAGRLQVKLFEPSIALESIIFLNLNVEEYLLKTRFFAIELAISLAASIANWMFSQKQAVGMITNGFDILTDQVSPLPLPPRKGRTHLMRLLEMLARIQTSDNEPCQSLVHRNRFNLSWGTTVVIITGQADESLFNEIFAAKKTGLDVVLVLCGEVMGLKEVKRKAKFVKVPLYYFLDERDLESWRN
jgi:uncharacterized protein (DUF58 family)